MSTPSPSWAASHVRWSLPACRYEPGINRSYADMATHYGTAIVATRVRKPRDKAKVEVAVQLVQRWVLARLRHRRFFSLAELNGAIGELIETLNSRPMRHLGASRRDLFEATERSALLRLPTEPYVYAEWRRCRAGIDYHVEVYGHWYSVPSRLMRETIEARITEQTVELFHRGTRVASHLRSSLRGRHTTIAEHMPSAHRRYADWTPTRLMREAAVIGPSTTALIEQILHAKPHPEQGFRACLGILRLVRAWGAERVEAACQRRIDIGARSYSSIASIQSGRSKPCRRARTRWTWRPRWFRPRRTLLNSTRSPPNLEGSSLVRSATWTVGTTV
jgi:transposase